MTDGRLPPAGSSPGRIVPGRHLVMAASTGSYMQRSERRHRGGDQLKHGGPCVHFSGISTCGRTSRETVSHPQHAPLPTLCKISLPVYVFVTNERLQPLTTNLILFNGAIFFVVENLTTFNQTSDFSPRPA